MKSMLAAMLLLFATQAMAAETNSHVHVAAFFKVPGQASFQWPDTIKGEDITGALKGKADYLIMTQTSGVHDGDVLNLQNDVLRGNGDNAFEDTGIDCQLSVIGEKPAEWKVGGKCTLNLPHGAEKQVSGLIPPHAIPAEKVWYHVWDDPQSGVAIYFYKENGAVLDR